MRGNRILRQKLASLMLYMAMVLTVINLPIFSTAAKATDEKGIMIDGIVCDDMSSHIFPFHYIVLHVDKVNETVDVAIFSGKGTETNPQYHSTEQDNLFHDATYPLSKFSEDVKVGDILDVISLKKCEYAKMVQRNHVCSDHLERIVKRDAVEATCTTIGYKDCYQCTVAECKKCWEDAACTKSIPSDQVVIEKLGHLRTITNENGVLSIGECQREGCDSQDRGGATLSINVVSSGYVRIFLDGISAYNAYAKTSITENDLRFYKYNDSKDDYEKINYKPSEDGAYSIRLTVPGYELRKDFVIDRSRGSILVGEVFQWNNTMTDSDTNYETENFLLNVPNGGSGGWTIEESKPIKISSKDNKTNIVRMDFYTNSAESTNRLLSPVYLFGGTQEKLSDTIVALDYLNSTHQEIFFQKPTNYNGSLLGEWWDLDDKKYPTILKIVVYYYPDNTHTHNFSLKRIIDSAKMKSLPCKGYDLYYRSCACGAHDTDDINVFEVPINGENTGHFAANISVSPKTAEFLSAEATCESPASYYYCCANCGEKLSETYTYGDPKGHNLSQFDQLESTCEAEGYRQYYQCDTCKKYFSDSEGTTEIANLNAWKAGEGCIAKKYHSGGQATCKEKAKCATCGIEYGDFADHEYSTEWSFDGTNHWHMCTVCGDEKDKTAHTLKNVVTKATQTQNGKIETKCTVCSKITKKTTIYAAKTIKLSATSFTYNGKEQKPSVIIKDNKGNIIDSSNYSLKYASGRKNVGTYTVNIKFKGNYSGNTTLSYTIHPLDTSISNITAGKKEFTVNWEKKTTQVTGYEIQYSTAKDFKSGNKTVKITSAKTVSKTIKSLIGGKKYYVRIRTYKTVSNSNYYSDWSAVKSVTTKN